MPLKSPTAYYKYLDTPQQEWAGGQHKPPGANTTPDKWATRLEKGGPILLPQLHFLPIPTNRKSLLGWGEKLSLKTQTTKGQSQLVNSLLPNNWKLASNKLKALFTLTCFALLTPGFKDAVTDLAPRARGADGVPWMPQDSWWGKPIYGSPCTDQENLKYERPWEEG